MTIEELAQHVGMTPRNIRAHQSRGLLYPPQIQDRVARYTGAHAARLLLIAALQREGFTLAAISRLIETPGSYSALVAGRRRRFRDGSSDLSPTVPVSEDRIRELFPDLPDDLTETGLVWPDADGQLTSSTILVDVGRMLLEQGVPADVVAALQLEAVRAGRELGGVLRGWLADEDPGTERSADLAMVAVQLSAAAFEIAFLDTATGTRPR